MSSWDPLKQVTDFFNIEKRIAQLELWQHQLSQITANTAAIVDLTNALSGFQTQLQGLGKGYQSIVDMVNSQAQVIKTLDLNQTEIQKALNDSGYALKYLQDAQNLASEAMIKVEGNVHEIQNNVLPQLATTLNTVSTVITNIRTNIKHFQDRFIQISSSFNSSIGIIQEHMQKFANCMDLAADKIGRGAILETIYLVIGLGYPNPVYPQYGNGILDESAFTLTGIKTLFEQLTIVFNALKTELQTI